MFSGLVVAATLLSIAGTASGQTCMPFVYGFEKNAAGLQLPGGTFADSQTFPLDFTVSASAGSGRRPMLYDTRLQTGNDANDLGLASNHHFKNVLIISTDNDSSDPDDHACVSGQCGGTFTFTFPTPVEITSIGLLDLEEQGSYKIYDSNGVVLTGWDNLPTMGNGASTRHALGFSNVGKMEVELASSGAITDIEFCVEPGTFGDPHFITWAGEFYDYHGICDLVFVESPAQNLAIHIRTTQKFHYSFISSAAVKINDDVFEFGSWGQVIQNGMYEYDDSDLPKTIGGHKLTVEVSNKKIHTYMIDFGNGSGIEVKSYKDMVSVRLMGEKAHFMDSRGLMGSPEDGVKVGREGQVINDINEFGQEWQVLADEAMLFDTAREPQAPAICFDPKPTESLVHRRLGETLARDEAEEACAKWHMNKEACIADVMITGDVELAAALYGN